jgi:hypothetical protein
MKALTPLLILLLVVLACQQSGLREIVQPPKPLTESSFTVEPRGYKYIQFTSSGQHVFGHFKAEGGSGNDIQVYVFARQL